MYKRDIYLDIDDNLNNYVKSVELDSNSRVWHFHLTVDYEPLDLTGKSVQFRAEKPDKTNVLNDCKIVDAEKGVVEVKLTRQVNAIPGHVKCLLKIIGDEGFVLKTKTFVVDVSKTLSDDAIVSSDEFCALEVALGKVQDIDNRFAQTNAQLSQEIDVERKRIDNFNTLQEGSTTGDAELKDIRIGHDGVTYANAGTAVREQIKQVASKFEQSINQLHLDNLTSDYEINPSTGELRSAMGWRATDFMPLQPNKYIFVCKENGKYIYGASCFWAVYDENKQYITGKITDAAGVDFINATDERVAYIRASFSKLRLQAEPMIVPKTYYSKLKDYLTPFKGVLLKDSPYLTECNSAIESDIRKRRIVAPKNVAVVNGSQLDVHYDNILLGADARLMPYKNYYGSAPAVNMGDMFRIDSLQTTTTTKASIRILNDGFVDPDKLIGEFMLTKDLYIVPVSKTAGEGMTRNVMFIGDSITANGLYPKEVVKLFANDKMNVNLVGTIEIGGVPHEGHGGWTTKDFCEVQSFNDYKNAFYNPTTQTFDFTYYMKTNGFTQVDDVFITLGINDMAKNIGIENIIGYYNKMINSIRAYNPKIRIFIGLPILPYTGKYSTVHGYNQFSKSQLLALHERLIEEYDEREYEGFYVVPFNLSIDTEHDFKFEEKPLSRRNDAVKVKYCTDVIHPSTVAYNKMADMAYWYIKYNL